MPSSSNWRQGSTQQGIDCRQLMINKLRRSHCMVSSYLWCLHPGSIHICNEYKQSLNPSDGLSS